MQAVVQHFHDVLALLNLRAVRIFRQETVEADVVDENLRADKAKEKEQFLQVVLLRATAHGTEMSERFGKEWSRRYSNFLITGLADEADKLVGPVLESWRVGLRMMRRSSGIDHDE